jgi:hypothetical protein
MSIIVSKYIYGDLDVDVPAEWAETNCPSFEKYMLVELDFEEREERGCWFRLDVYFTEEKDAMFYSLRWS